MAHQVEVLCNVIGLESILNKCDLAFLRQVCATMGLTAPDVKIQMAYAIATQTSVPLDAVTVKPKKADTSVVPGTQTFSAVKLPLEKGITYQDVFQHYYQNELIQFCRDHGLKSTGSKSKLIQRILNYLNSGIVEPPSGPSRSSTGTAIAPVVASAVAMPGGASDVGQPMQTGEESGTDDDMILDFATEEMEQQQQQQIPRASIVSDSTPSTASAQSQVAPQTATSSSSSSTGASEQTGSADVIMTNAPSSVSTSNATYGAPSEFGGYGRKVTPEDVKRLEEQRRTLLLRRVKVVEALARLEQISK
jgi:hypothetical protein